MDFGAGEPRFKPSSLLINCITMGQIAHLLSVSVFSSNVGMVAITTVPSPRIGVGIKRNASSKVLRVEPGTQYARTKC